MSRPHALATLTGAALLLTAVLPAAASIEDGLDQNVDRGEEIGTAQVVVDSGHVDIGPRFIDGEWTVLARDDTSAPPVWRELDDLVLRLGDTAVLPAPEDEQFAFIDAEPGADVHVIPQTEDYEVPWLGWNSQDPEVVDQLVRGMTLRLHGVQGPGQLTVFLQSGNFADAELLWTSDDPQPQDIWADTNTHVHANWVFTDPGTYLVDVELRGELTDGTTAGERAVLRFAVGEDTDPAEAFAATFAGGQEAATDDGKATTDAASATEEATAADDAGGPAAEDAAEEGGSAAPLLAIGIAAVVLVFGAIVAAGVMRSRRDRRAALEPGDER
ncbi:choice-of-anchor M domain-containing protein [Georgenia satyanarayanai]|uniref:choice-of-anchor M domain-containing protein n=1 Tax=Georgenia satyanarayanai TaxID=860221 RepID=UPI001D0203B9|nr:choice-of-anchor M domain-containing protein [Georgenia satyanarayanai]